MDLDKWQEREARQHAADNGLSYEEAVAELFPAEPAPVAEATPDDVAAEAPADDAAAKAAPAAKAPAGK